MLHVSHRRSMREASLLIVLMTLGVLATWAVPEWLGLQKIENYLPVHTMLEMASVVIAVLVFASGWNAYSRSLPRNAVVLACAFLGVAMLDFSHALSYAGMPDYVTVGSPPKAINFWLAARLLAAVALLGVAVMPARPLASTYSRYSWLVGVLAVVGAAHAVFLWRPEWVPVTFEAGKGLTPFKIGAEYVIVALNGLAAWRLWKIMAQPQPFNAAALFGAVCAMALSECFFTLYGRVNDYFNLMGHLYKIVSYLFLYRAVFVEVVEAPYREMAAMRDQLRATLDAVPDVMIEMDLDGRYHAVHSSRPETLLRPVHTLIGKTVFDILPRRAAETVIAALHEALNKGSSIGVQLDLDSPHRRRWYELSVARKGLAAGKDTRFIVLSRDITERKLAEAAVLEQETATQASKAKSEFLSRVSHELRTPLNAVIGFAQLLLHGNGSGMSAGQKLHVEYILRAGHHLLDMINDIMDLTRIESGDAELSAEAVGVFELLQDTLPMVMPQAEAMGVAVHVSPAINEHVQFLGDKRRIKQVVINILSNAVKYNQVGGKVTVQCVRSEARPGQLDLVISDTGRGLTAEQQRGLFEPFNRLGADHNGIEGTGLGLVISRRLVEAMGGAIALDSTLGEGTVVTISLPMAQQASQPHMPGLGGEAPSKRASEAKEPCVATVLCVEDNPLNAALLRAIFDLRPSLKLHIVEDGQTALERFSKVRPDLVLIDLNLPDMRGAEVLHKIRELPEGQDAVCIAMSADVFGEPLERARQQGFADFWPKPLDVNGVLRRLDTVLASMDVRQARLWSMVGADASVEA